MNWKRLSRRYCESERLTRLARGVQQLTQPRVTASVDDPPDKLLAWTDRFFKPRLTCEPSSFHEWLCDELDRLVTDRGQRINILAPRGAAKSTYASLAYPLREALEGREPFITICSDTGDQARDFLRDIRDQLEFNEELRAAYPSATGVGRVWRDNHIVLRNGVAIRALGTGGKIRGRKAGGVRPTLVVIDDPQNKDHITSSLQRERAWEWLTKDVLSAGEPSTNVVVLGTALHRDCIVCKLQGTPGWTSRVFRSIVQWPARMDLWRSWENLLFDHENEKREENARAFYEKNKEAMNE